MNNLEKIFLKNYEELNDEKKEKYKDLKDFSLDILIPSIDEWVVSHYSKAVQEWLINDYARFIEEWIKQNFVEKENKIYKK